MRNGAYALQWWLFAGFAVVMAVKDRPRPAAILERDADPRPEQSRAHVGRRRLARMRAALIRYRIMAYLVGSLLVVLVWSACR